MYPATRPRSGGEVDSASSSGAYFLSLNPAQSIDTTPRGFQIEWRFPNPVKSRIGQGKPKKPSSAKKGRWFSVVHSDFF